MRKQNVGNQITQAKTLLKNGDSENISEYPIAPYQPWKAGAAPVNEIL